MVFRPVKPRDYLSLKGPAQLNCTDASRCAPSQICFDGISTRSLDFEKIRLQASQL